MTIFLVGFITSFVFSLLGQRTLGPIRGAIIGAALGTIAVLVAVCLGVR